MICERDCFNCSFDDCIVDEMSAEECKEIDARNKRKPKRVLSEKSRQHSKEYCKKYYREHRKKLLQYRKKYYETHKEECKRNTRERYQRKKRERENA